MDLAEHASGPISRPVDPAYVWGAALDVQADARPHARIINLENSITKSDHSLPKGINYRMHPGNVDVLRAAAVDCCALANNHVLDFGQDRHCGRHRASGRERGCGGDGRCDRVGYLAKGIGSDALSAVSVIPIGKAASMIVKVGVQRIAVRSALYSSVRGGLCAPISGTQAVRRSGQSVLVKLDVVLQKSHGAQYANLAAEARYRNEFSQAGRSAEGVRCADRVPPGRGHLHRCSRHSHSRAPMS
ncbi:MAG: CapA family protein [Longimicrobiales bacterium]